MPRQSAKGYNEFVKAPPITAKKRKRKGKSRPGRRLEILLVESITKRRIVRPFIPGLAATIDLPQETAQTAQTARTSTAAQANRKKKTVPFISEKIARIAKLP